MRTQVNTRRISGNFFAHCDQSGGPTSCWPFLRARDPNGYGRVWADGKVQQAHRYAYTISRGVIPRGLGVLHSCDNPACCNPHHLFVGTQYDNVRDMDAKGRANRVSGEAIGNSKLSTRDVIFIRRCRDLYSTAEMAEMLGVDDNTVAAVVCGKTWAHVIEAANLREPGGPLEATT